MGISRLPPHGAFATESTARNCPLALFFDSTLVIAAVNVVLPWSMCPIVPTFTCGLLRSNFSFAISPHLAGGSRLLPRQIQFLPFQNFHLLVLSITMERGTGFEPATICLEG